MLCFAKFRSHVQREKEEDVPVPSEQEYGEIINRLQGAMLYACQELATLADGVTAGLSNEDADEIATRLRNLAVSVIERIGGFDDPAPRDLPDGAKGQLPAVGVSRRNKKG
jgi:hypothetical protein